MTKKIIPLFLLSASLLLTACSGVAETPVNEDLNDLAPAEETTTSNEENEEIEETENNTSEDNTLTSEATTELKAKYQQALLNDTVREISVSVNQPILIEVEGALVLEDIQASNPEFMKIIAVHYYTENELVKSLVEIQPTKKGEHFVTLSGGESDLSFQIFALDYSNTEGNIVELVGTIASIQADSIELSVGEKTHYIYAPSSKEITDFQVGDHVLLGARLGEASYQLAFITNKEDLTTATDLPIIQHVVKVESVQQESVEVLWNDALLTLYHNDLLTTDYEGVYVYVEYAVDKANEANELLKAEKIK